MSQNHAAEVERQELIKHCHSLVAAIANQPGSIKLLRGILPMLETFAEYKVRRSLEKRRLTNTRGEKLKK
jgi:hypothetical protein